MDLLRQLDADWLDAELHRLASAKVTSLLESLQVISSDYEPELATLVPLTLDVGSLLLWRRTYGQTLASIQPEKTSLARLLLKPIIVAVATYISKRGLQVMLLHRFHRAEERSWRRRVLRLLVRMQQVVELALTLNYVAFLCTGRHPTLTDQVLRLSYRRDPGSGPVTSLGYLKQELLIQVLLAAMRQTARLPISMPAWLSGSSHPRRHNHSGSAGGSISHQQQQGPPSPSSLLHVSSMTSGLPVMCVRCEQPCVQLPCTAACGHTMCFSCGVSAFMTQGGFQCGECGAVCRPSDLRTLLQCGGQQ